MGVFTGGGGGHYGHYGDFLYNIVELKGGSCTSGFGMKFCIIY